MTEKIETLYRKLGYHFRDIRLINMALTHRSRMPLENNERLEFLGDSVLNCVIAEILFKRFPDLPEGMLSRLRASLVNQSALIRLAEKLELTQHLLIGRGEEKKGSQFPAPSILAGTMEAVIGAIFLEGGFETVRERLRVWYESFLQQTITDPERVTDAKTRLQEWLHAKKQPLPIYQVVNVSGQTHCQQFTIICQAGGKETRGMGSAKRYAEQEAAEKMLKRLKEE